MIKKVIEIADIHIGGKHDINNLKSELIFFLNFCSNYKPNIIVILGDLFDKKITVGSIHDQLCRWFFFELLKLNCYVLYEYGTQSHECNAIDSYKEFIGQKFQVYKIATNNYIDGLHILHLPEEYENDKEKYYKPFFDAGKKDKYDFIFGHGILSTVPFLDKIYGKKKSNKIVFFAEDFKDIVNGSVDFGHYHINTETKDGLLNYPGSFSRDSFGEEKPKGFYIREYDTNKKQIIKKEFIENKLAPIYKTINSKILSEEKLFEDIRKEQKNTYSLRIIVDTDISETKLHNILAYTYEHPEVVLEKRFMGLSKKYEDEKNIEVQERRKKRHELLDRFKNMDFFEITKIIAKEKFNIEFTIEEIKELIK